MEWLGLFAVVGLIYWFGFGPGHVTTAQSGSNQIVTGTQTLFVDVVDKQTGALVTSTAVTARNGGGFGASFLGATGQTGDQGDSVNGLAFGAEYYNTSFSLSTPVGKLAPHVTVEGYKIGGITLSALDPVSRSAYGLTTKNLTIGAGGCGNIALNSLSNTTRTYGTNPSLDYTVLSFHVVTPSNWDTTQFSAPGCTSTSVPRSRQGSNDFFALKCTGMSKVANGGVDERNLGVCASGSNNPASGEAIEVREFSADNYVSTVTGKIVDGVEDASGNVLQSGNFVTAFANVTVV